MTSYLGKTHAALLLVVAIVVVDSVPGFLHRVVADDRRRRICGDTALAQANKEEQCQSVVKTNKQD